MDSVAEKTIAQLHQRIEHLEENRRFFHNSLEMVLNLADFRNNLGENNNETFFLAEGIDRIRKIVPLECCSIYLVDDQTAEFKQAYCYPCECNGDFNEQVEHLIDNGMFAWAVRERKGVFTLNRAQRQTLLHVIGNYSGVKGMFIGVLEKDQQEITQSSLILVTFILFSLANILENIFLYQEVKKQNALLEVKVAERTKSLNASTEELKITMQRLKKFARLAEQSNKSKSQFLANMSHEIRTPLNGIIGCTELMLKSDSLTDCHHLAGVSLNEAEHLLHLINNVLDYSKIEAGHIKMEKQPLNLGQLVKLVTDGLATQASTKGVALRYEMDENLSPAVMGDALRLRQILINLANNAIKFTSEGSVTIRITQKSITADGRQQSVNFAVIDTGIGIPQERQAAIFKRFTQVDESITRRYGGTGLGTTIAHQLVTLMGGRLILESQVGRGSVFSFTINMDSAPAEAVEPFVDATDRLSLPALTGQKPVNILVAEDARVNQMVLRSHLENFGHRVTIAENGRLAIEACRTDKFDLIFMDVQMPEIDGITATQTILAEADKDTAPIVIALTADVQAKTRLACEAAGAVARVAQTHPAWGVGRDIVQVVDCQT